MALSQGRARTMVWRRVKGVVQCHWKVEELQKGGAEGEVMSSGNEGMPGRGPWASGLPLFHLLAMGDHYASCQDVLPQTGPKTTGPRDRGQNPLKLEVFFFLVGLRFELRLRVFKAGVLPLEQHF